MSDRVIQAVEADGQVWLLTLNAPHIHNALDPPAMIALHEACAAFEADRQSRVLIITGAGSAAFCAGADLTATAGAGTGFLGAWIRDAPAAARDGMYLRTVLIDRIVTSKPVIAAVNGYAVGGGLELAMNCDFRILAQSARIGLPEVTRGSIPAAGAIQRLIQTAGLTVATDIAMTGRLVDAIEARAMGVATDVVPDEALLTEARALAARLAANAPLGLSAIKRLLTAGAELDRERYLDVEQLLWGHVANTADRAEGRAAFAAKRRPEFRGA